MQLRCRALAGGAGTTEKNPLRRGRGQDRAAWTSWARMRQRPYIYGRSCAGSGATTERVRNGSGGPVREAMADHETLVPSALLSFVYISCGAVGLVHGQGLLCRSSIEQVGGRGRRAS